MELPSRTPAAATTISLRDHEWRRPAQRRATSRECVVILPRARLRPNQTDARERRFHGAGCSDDDQHDCQLARAWLSMATTFQSTGGRGDVREHQASRTAAME